MMAWWILVQCLLYLLPNEVVAEVYWFHSTHPSVCPSICLSVHPACVVCSVTPIVLDGFFPYWAHMITSMRGFVSRNDLWSRLISSRSFSHDFAIKLLKYGTSYQHKWITSMRGCVACNNLWTWPISSRYWAVTLPISWSIFICGTNTTHEGMMSQTISRSIALRSRSHRSFKVVRLGVS